MRLQLLMVLYAIQFSNLKQLPEGTKREREREAKYLAILSLKLERERERECCLVSHVETLNANVSAFNSWQLIEFTVHCSLSVG